MGKIAKKHFKAIWQNEERQQPTLEDFNILNSLEYNNNEHLKDWIDISHCEEAIKATNLTKAIGEDMLDMSILKENPTHHNVKLKFMKAMITWAKDA